MWQTLRCLTIVALSLFAWCVDVDASTVEYQTKTLRQLAERIKFNPDTATFQNNVAVGGTVRGRQTVVEKGSNGMITHVGLSLFPQELKGGNEMQPLLMRFLERYFLDLLTQKATTLENCMADDKVYFRKGTLSNVPDLTPGMPFTLTGHDNFYEATWQRNGTPFVTVVFPKQAELVYGATFTELQDAMQNLVRNASGTYARDWTEAQLTEVKDGILRTESKRYVIDEVSDALYLQRIDGKLQPVFSDAHAEESAANLLLGALPEAESLMAVEQSKYGFNTESYTVKLSQWLAYCAANGLYLYYAVEEVREDGIKAFVLAENRELHYNHVLTVIIPQGFANASNRIVKVRLNAFIPTHNVKELYQKYSNKKKPVKYE